MVTTFINLDMVYSQHLSMLLYGSLTQHLLIFKI